MEFLSRQFWRDEEGWPADLPNMIFLARAVLKVGRVLFATRWTGTEPLIEGASGEFSWIAGEPAGTISSWVGGEADRRADTWLSRKSREISKESGNRFQRLWQTCRWIAERVSEQQVAAYAMTWGGSISKLDQYSWQHTPWRDLFYDCQLPGAPDTAFIFLSRNELDHELERDRSIA